MSPLPLPDELRPLGEWTIRSAVGDDVDPLATRRELFEFGVFFGLGCACAWISVMGGLWSIGWAIAAAQRFGAWVAS